jgi:ubiquinone/menaquinone biosynthesis C-methylase UbiE
MRSAKSKSNKSSSAMQRHYESVKERSRLLAHTGRLEFYRTKEIILRHMRGKRLVVLDVGGGPGAYAMWLAELGHKVHLVDPVPKHVHQAEDAPVSQLGARLESATVGDARNLKFADRFADIVLLLGPLYHLTKKRDRMNALAEARRALKPGGLVFVAAISRFASAFDGMFRGFMRDPEFFKIMRRDLRTGQHRNPKNRPEYFTTAYFHAPAELESEIQKAGFALEKLYAVEGAAWLLHDFDNVWRTPKLRARMLHVLHATENEPALIGQSAHIVAVARKPR